MKPHLRDYTVRAQRQYPHPDTPLRAVILLVYSGAGLMSVSTWGIMHIAVGAWGSAVPYFISFGFIFAVAAGAYRSGYIRPASHLLALNFAIVATYGTYITGGLIQSNITPFFALSISSFFLLGRQGVPWALVFTAIPLGFELLHWYDYPFPLSSATFSRLDAAFTWIVMALVIFGAGMAYEIYREKATLGIAQADRAKSQLMSTLSHELRTPLHILNHTLSSLRDQPVVAPHREQLHTAEAQVGRLSQLVQDLLDVSRLDGTIWTFQPKNFDPVEEIATLAPIFEDRCRKTGLSWMLHFDPMLPVEIHGDPLALQRTLDNLISNAVKFTRTGGVTLVVEPLHAHGLRIRVRDTGQGIAPAEQKRIFSRFYQVDGALSRSRGGVGLGLSIVHRIAHAMKGKVYVTSDLGKGAEFTVDLPFAAPVTPPPAPMAPVVTRPTHVLVVDDIEDSRSMMIDLLELMNYSVTTADGGASALEIWEREVFDIVFLDIQMPEMDGFQLLQHLRERMGGAHTPVILAMTGYGSESERQPLLDAGFDDAIFKPFGRANLAALLARVSERPTTGSAVANG